MAAISQSVPTLLGGVSQQPDPIKLPGQVRQADNVYLDPTFGCVKRPATKYIDKVADDIPNDAKWFSIFRDNNERYLGCCYQNDDTNNLTPKTRFRVFEADSGIERNVSYAEDCENYLDPGSFRDLQFLTINDYTFIANPAITVSMSSGGKTPQPHNEALVVINQIGYNTTYQIDLLKEDEELDKVETKRASQIAVIPGTWEEEDQDGGCSYAGTQEYTQDSGLKYRLTVNCQPTQVTKYKDGNPFPTQVELQKISDKVFAEWAAINFGSPFDVPINSYAYTNVNCTMDGKAIEIRVEARNVKICKYGEDSDGQDKNLCKWVFSSADIISYGQGGWSEYGKPKWVVGADGDTESQADVDVEPGFSADGFDVCNDNQDKIKEGEKRKIRFEVTAIDKGPKVPQYSYKSVYTANVQLLNGGVDVEKGDVVQSSLNNKTYKIKVVKDTSTYVYEADASVTYTTPSSTTAGPLDLASVTGALTSQLNNLPSWTADSTGNVIKIRRNNDKVFNINARGGSTENAMYAIKDRVSDISKLPNVGFDDVLLKVQNSLDSEADDYYVRFITSGGVPGAGSWEETAKPGIKTSFNASTMPHALKRKKNGNFKIINLAGVDTNDVISWADREVGDEDTNPVPTFVGQKINNMVFHMNRFGFLSEDTVILSQPGDYFNFFVGSAIAVSDADPIDMAATSTRPANLTDGISTAAGLLLFSTDAQFLMNTRDVAFGPSTVQINEVSNYAFRTTTAPITVGSSIFFASDSTNFSKVFEMSIKSIGESPQVAEDTRIVPEYVPNNLTWNAASSNNNLALFGVGDQDVYCFKYWNQGDERSLAGWFRWRFLHEVKLVEFYDDVAYIAFYNPVSGETVLGTMSLMDDPDVATIWADDRSFEPRLDLYLDKGNLTTAVGPITSGGDTTTNIYLPDGTNAGQELAYLQFTRSSGTYFTAAPIEYDDEENETGPYVNIRDRVLNKAKAYNLGIAYNMAVELPSFFAKDDKRVDRVNAPMIETVNVELYLSGSYSVILEKLGYEDRVLYYDAKVADVYKADSNPIIETSKKEVHVFSRGDHAKMTIISLDPLPAGITGYTWEGHYNTRGITKT